MSNRTQNEIVLQSLQAGRSLTSNQLRNQFRIPGYRAVINRLRNEGNCIYTNRDSRGRVSYRLGTPKRSMIAFAYQAAALFGTNPTVR